MSDKAFTIITNTDDDEARSITILNKPRLTIVPAFNDNLHIREAHQSFAVLGRTQPHHHQYHPQYHHQYHPQYPHQHHESSSESSVVDSTSVLSDIEEEDSDTSPIISPSPIKQSTSSPILSPVKQPMSSPIKVSSSPTKKYSVPGLPRSWIPHKISYNNNPDQQDSWISKIDYHQPTTKHKNKKWISSKIPAPTVSRKLPSLPRPRWSMQQATVQSHNIARNTTRLALTDDRINHIPEELFKYGFREKENLYDKEGPRVPFNTPEVLSSSSDSSSGESSPEMPLRKQKVKKALRKCRVFFRVDADDDDEYTHLDFQREDHLASYCRTKLNRVTARTLYLALMEMRRRDLSQDQVLSPQEVDSVMVKMNIPLAACMPHLHEKFRDKVFRRSTNYEKLMLYLDERRAERQRRGPEEVEDWSQVPGHQRRAIRFIDDHQTQTSKHKPRYNMLL